MLCVLLGANSGLVKFIESDGVHGAAAEDDEDEEDDDLGHDEL